MKVSDLHGAFLTKLAHLLPDWKFVKSQRYFKRQRGDVNWLFHVSFINHVEDFDAVGNVAVEFLAGRKRATVIGASLGNIAGVGQTRHGVDSVAAATAAARSIHAEFHRVGMPFLERYSDPALTLQVLLAGGSEARLICPVGELQSERAAALQALGAPPNNSSKPTPLRGAA